MSSLLPKTLALWCCALVHVACGPQAPPSGAGGGTAQTGGGSGGSGGGTGTGGGETGGGGGAAAGGAGGGSGGGTSPAPVPRLSNTPLTPATATAGAAAFELTVRGDDFVAASVVRWNGAARPTTYFNATELRAQIQASDVAAAGMVAITVFTPAPGGGESAAATFVVENPAPTLDATMPVTPASAEAGGPGLTLVVRGNGFVDTSVVRWNGQDRPTTHFRPVRELHATIPAGDLVEGGVNVTVFTPAPGGGQTPPFMFRVVPRRGAFLRASLSDLNAQADDTSLHPALSATGRWVAFASEATNLVPGDTWGAGDVFLRDTCLGASGCAPSTVRLSVTPTGGEGFSHSSFPAITPDARFVTFTSHAPNLVLNDTNGVADVFLRDTCVGASGCTPLTIRVSVDSNGIEGNAESDLSSVSADGRYVVFRSVATNLVAGDTNGYQDVFVRDTCRGAPMVCAPTTVRVSVSTAGVQGNQASGVERPVISADGRYVAFSSMASNLSATPDMNARSDVFVRDTCAGASGACAPTTTRVSVTNAGLESAGASTHPAITADGRRVVFSSSGADLVSGDTNGTFDIFVRDTCTGAPTGCTPGTTRVSLTTAGAEANGANTEPTVSADGRYVGWTTTAQNLSTAQVGGVVRDTCLGATACTPATVHVTVAAAGGTDPVVFWSPLVLSGNGRVAAWVADQAGIVPNDTNNRRDVFLSHTGL